MLKNELHIPTKKYANLVQFTLNNSSASPISVDFGDNFTLVNTPTSANLLPANNNVSTFFSGGKNINSALNTNNYTLYIATNTNNVVVYSIATNSTITTINIGEPQAGILYVPLTNTIYVSSSISSNTFVIDCSSNTLVATILGADIGFGMAFNPNNNFLYGVGVSSVYVINVVTNTIETNIFDTLFNAPFGISINTDNNLAYVTNSGSDEIFIINCSNNLLLPTIITLNPASAPASIVYNQNNNLIYVANFGTSSVSVCNPNTNTLLFDVALIPNTQPLLPYDLVLNNLTNELFITSNGNEEQYSIFDCNSNTFLQTILIGSSINQLNGIIINPDSAILYIAGSDSNNLYGYNSVNTPQNPYFVTGSVDYNFFIQNLAYEPIKVEYIRMSTINSSIEAQKPFYNTMEMVQISATGLSKTYANLPISRIDAQESQNIVLLPFKNLIMDGRTYLSNYVLNPYTQVTFDIYFSQLNRGTIEFYPHLFEPKKQLKDYIKAFSQI
jgi:DNA-binding beta-propeller fold protein YncE